MGYSGYLEYKIEAQKLRQKGLSYGEILQTIPVSKDTISRWCKDIELSNEQKQKLIKNKQFGQKKGSLIAAENKKNQRIKKTLEIQKIAKAEIGDLVKRDRFIAGIALYAGEGDKAVERVGFSNSDPKLINFMAKWFREFLAIPTSKMRGAIWIHEGLDENKAKLFWSKLTKIPTNQFHKTYIAENKIESKKIRKNIHEYGVFSIRVSDTAKHRKIMGWILALLDGKIHTVH